MVDPPQPPHPPYGPYPPQPLYGPHPPHAQVPPPPRRVVTRSGISGTGVATHLLLTLLTCGCWLPVWFLHWLFTRNRQVTHY